MKSTTIGLGFLASFTAVAAQQAGDSIHGTKVSAECVKAYTDAFGPELVRTDKFLALAAAVTTPDDLKKRAGAAAEALKKYQDELKKLDAKLADPLTDVEKKELEVARTGTSDVGETLAVLSASTDDKIKGAYKEFMDARKAETDAGAKVDTACPPGIE